MRTLAFDGRTGASGDMLLAALISAGADPSVLAPVEDALDVEYVVGEERRHGVTATSVNVRRSGEDGPAHDAEGHGPHRHYDEVVSIVEDMDLTDGLEATALGAFERLGEAEAAVHATDLEAVHFHEVGADDAIADVVGVALLVADLDVERVVTTPVAVGGGEVETSHGTYPVPVPAVTELVEAADWSVRGGPVEMELLTPTGAALLAELADGVDSLPAMDVAATGYGAGDRTFDARPNALRALVGDATGGLNRETVTVLETNVDDVAPEVLGDLQRSLADVGALDVTAVPATMKKARPGHVLKVVCDPADVERVARRLVQETGTLGVREAGGGHRFTADRRIESAAVTVDGATYEVAVKIATDDAGAVLDVSAEYADAARVADATDAPLRTIMRRAEAAWRAD